MNKIVHYIGLDVHKDSIAVAPQNSTEVRRYGIIGGTLEGVDKLLKRLSQPNDAGQRRRGKRVQHETEPESRRPLHSPG